MIYENMSKGFDVYNVSSDETISVLQIAEELTKVLSLSDVTFSFTGGKRGWKGDVPYTSVDIAKLQTLGWRASNTIKNGINKYVEWLEQL